MANSNTTRERKRDKLLSFGQQTIKVATSTAAAAANTAAASINSSVGKGGREQSAGMCVRATLLIVNALCFWMGGVTG